MQKVSKRNGDHTQRERILKIAAKLFAQNGFNAVGMTELGDAVELGRGALYHHIKNKEEILYDISKQYITNLVDHGNIVISNESDAKTRLQKLGHHLMVTIATYQPELTVCFREIYSLTGPRREEVLLLHAEYEHIWRHVLIEGEKKGIFRPFNPVRLKGLLGMFFYSYIWMNANGSQKPENIAEIFNDIVLRALV